MLASIINQFRKNNGINPAKFDDYDQNSYCLLHCLAMAGRGELYHAESNLLGDWAEAVATCDCNGDWGVIENRLIWDILGRSEAHKQIVLKEIIAYGIAFRDNRVWLTVRGR